MSLFRYAILLLGFTLCASVIASAQPISNSKLSAHLINGYTVGSSNIVAGRPRLLKVLALDSDFASGLVQAMRDYKLKVPNGKVVVRVYSPKTYSRSDDATWSAGDFWTNILQASLNRISPTDRSLINYLEGPNEGQTPTLGYDPSGTDGTAASQWFNQFWTNLTPRIAAAGYLPCIGSIAVGNPGSLSDLDWFIPALRQAKSYGGAWSYHSYTINYTTDVAQEVWYSLRYRQFYDYFRQNYSDLANMPLILTEGGVDYSGNPNTSGWQARGSTADYQRWLNWFDRRMMEDSYVFGCTLFQNGDPTGWASFDLEVPMNGGITPMANWLGTYLSNPTNSPTAPTGVSASSGSSKVRLTWTSIPANPTTYTVKRSDTPGGPYVTIATNITEGVNATTFDDSTCVNGVQYSYVVSAVTAYGESTNSAEASAASALPKINCGGGAVGSFGEDDFYSGGLTYAPSDSIDLTGVSNPAPMAVYQSQRYGNMTYTLQRLPPATSFKVRLHFAEVYSVFNSPGQRVFNVLINGSQVLNNFDIFVAAGGQFKANIQEFNAISDPLGRMTIQFLTIVDNASINGIELLPNPTNSIPGAPNGLSATASAGKVALNWSAPVGATSFKVKRSTTSGGPYSIIASNLWSASFNDVSFTPNTTYYYVVSAANALGESGNSSQVSARPTVGLPDVIVTSIGWTPTNVTPGANVLFKAIILNQGSAATPFTNHGIGFIIDGTQVSWASSNLSLAVGQSAQLAASGGPGGTPYWTATLGNHAVVANVDDVNRFPEALEDNNTLSVPLVVAIPPPQFSAATVTNSTVRLTWTTFPGRSYKVQFKADLNATLWNDLGTTNLATGSSLQATDSVAPTQRYYRIVQVD